MIESRSRARFLLEAVQPFGIGTQPCGEDFDGHVSPKPRITRDRLHPFRHYRAGR